MKSAPPLNCARSGYLHTICSIVTLLRLRLLSQHYLAKFSHRQDLTALPSHQQHLQLLRPQAIPVPPASASFTPANHNSSIRIPCNSPRSWIFCMVFRARRRGIPFKSKVESIIFNSRSCLVVFSRLTRTQTPMNHAFCPQPLQHRKSCIQVMHARPTPRLATVACPAVPPVPPLSTFSVMSHSAKTLRISRA